MPVPRRPVVAGELGSASPTPHSRQRRSSTQVMMDCCQAMPASEEHEQYGGNAMDLSHNAEPHRVRGGKVRSSIRPRNKVGTRAGAVAAAK